MSRRSPSFGSGSASLQPAELISRRSSPVPQRRERQPLGSHKLSAESWVKQSGQQAMDHPPAHNNLDRNVSPDTLWPQEAVQRHSRGHAKTPATLAKMRREELDRRTPPPSRTRDRLYLDAEPGDNVSTGRSTPSSRSARSGRTASPAQEEKQPFPDTSVSVPATSKTSLIADSIPLRTSSLRQSSSVPTPLQKKKSKAAHRQTIANSPFKSHRTDDIPDTSWVDLGEDDETVKRIMQLRKRRETRLLESEMDQLPRFLDLAPPDESSAPASPMSVSRVDDMRQSKLFRPAPSRSNTEPATKAQKLLGLDNQPQMPRPTNGLLTPTTSSARASPEFIRTSSPQLAGPKLPGITYDRPDTATSTSSPISLDYSYLQAMNGVGREAPQVSPRVSESTRPSVDAAIPKNVPSKRESVTTLRRADSQSETSSSLGTKSRDKKNNQKDRWTTVAHPDFPLDFDKKRNRRKSMNDAARNARIAQEELELQQRRDSVEDAVLEYLRAPRLNQKIRHPISGRTISFSEVGDPQGAAVLICVGMGLTRYVTAFYDELATTLRLRLITLERPGVGSSGSYPSSDKSGPLNWPDDVLTVCEQLKITHFSLLAHSAGAVYALATALILPHMVTGKVHLLAPWIPPSQLEAVSNSASAAPPAAALPRSQRLLRVLPTPFLRAANSSFMTAASASLKPASKRKPTAIQSQSDRSAVESPSRARLHKRPSTSDGQRPDFQRRESMMLMDQYMPSTNPMENFPIPLGKIREDDGNEGAGNALFLTATATPTDPEFSFASTGLNAAEHAERERQAEYTTRLTQRTWEYAIRDSNPATDLLVCLERNRDVGFRYTDVSRPVVITHGSEDKRVPVANVRWLGTQMNRNAISGPRVNGSLMPSITSVRSRDTNASGFDNFAGSGGCEVRVLPGEGHGLMASPLIMGDILTEIAGYHRQMHLY